MLKEKDGEYFDAKNLRLDQALKIASLAILVNKAPFIRESASFFIPVTFPFMRFNKNALRSFGFEK